MKISVRGPIISSNDQWIYDWFGIDATSPKKVSDILDSIAPDNKEDIIVEINSGGGSVYAASEIYTLLKDHPNNVVSKILGLAASAASYIALGANKVLMAPTGQIMIHNASAVASGDYRDMDLASNILKNTNIAIANAYKLKTGKSHEELLSMMDEEKWLTAQQAKEVGLIDEIMFDNGELAIVANAHTNSEGMLPQQVLDKFRSEMMGMNISGEGAPAQITNQVAVPVVSNQTQQKEEPKSMDLETFKNDHPELFNQVKNLGYEEGVTAENARIKDIEDLQMPGNEELINKAKFEDKIEASALAVEIIKAEKARGANYLNNVNNDAQIMNQVPGGDAPGSSKNNQSNEINALTNALNGAQTEEDDALSNALGEAL